MFVQPPNPGYLQRLFDEHPEVELRVGLDPETRRSGSRLINSTDMDPWDYTIERTFKLQELPYVIVWLTKHGMTTAEACDYFMQLWVVVMMGMTGNFDLGDCDHDCESG